MNRLHSAKLPAMIRGDLMRKCVFVVLGLLFLPCISSAQAKPKLAPAVAAFVKEDAATIALTHVRVIDGTGAVAKRDQTLLISGGKIAWMGDSNAAKAPDGAK